jgi:hypothetical protein
MHPEIDSMPKAITSLPIAAFVIASVKSKPGRSLLK